MGAFLCVCECVRVYIYMCVCDKYWWLNVCATLTPLLQVQRRERRSHTAAGQHAAAPQAAPHSAAAHTAAHAPSTLAVSQTGQPAVAPGAVDRNPQPKGVCVCACVCVCVCVCVCACVRVF
jgi:hypothetical protein